MQVNANHLTRWGDYADLVASSIEDIAEGLTDEPDRHYRFGILLSGDMIGRVDLIGVAPPIYGLGYWLAASHVGRGVAQAAVRRVVHFAFDTCAASDIYAGVTHGNDRSMRLLGRLGFEAISRFDNYTRFHRRLR
ncbi:GNAT family N-acetyltransferase [Devosia chinhatensis]|uniref:GNAT family N-acetyltransferase n=1 Tax=Devosia chinhatensis TaxID=429727 RepID=UPI000696CC81|nr:GNAT family N-acetyltransferase [Devosia chinhatensis]